MTLATVADCRLVELPKFFRTAGTITAVESDGPHVPFEIARVFFAYDVVGGAVRGGHAHFALEQLIVAAMGAFSVIVWDGEHTRTFELNRAYHGLYIPPMLWADLVNFSSGAVSIVLASLEFDEADYIRDRDAFARERGDAVA